MVLFRLLQGVFGASLVPLSQSVLLDSYPREKHGSAMAMWGMGVMVGPILGPTLGGWLTETYNWRWVFYINLPIGILTFVGLSAYLTETKTQQVRFDWFGFACSDRHRRAADDARPRRTARLVLLDRDLVEAGARGARLLPLPRADLHLEREEQPFIDPAIFATATSRSA